MPDFNTMSEVNICMLVFSALVTAFLLNGSAMDRARKRPFMRCFICLLTAHALMQLGEAGIWLFTGSPEKEGIVKFCCVLSFGIGSIVIALFTYCLLALFRERRKVSLLPAHIIAFFCAVLFFLVLTSVSNGIFFSVDEKGCFVDGPYGFVVNVFDVVMFLAEICLIIYYRSFFSVQGLLSLLSYCILPLAAMLLKNIWYPTPVYLSTTLTLILIFFYFHRELTRQLVEIEKELAESRIAIMVSQIQPHFLYNSLNTMYHLCDKDVNLAKQAISDFSEYLKHILGSVNRTTPIPFDEELQHVKTYLELEQMRFDEDLHVIYQIEATGFFVPALSVQPLVENAVKHGICRKKEGGTITLSTKECASCFEIVIADDGVGFEPSKKLEDGKLHVGIQNVRQRLHDMCNGTLTIESKSGEGSVATIRLPKEEDDEDTCYR